MSSGQYTRDRRRPRPIARQVRQLVRSLTEPTMNADFGLGPGLTASAWHQTRGQWNGHAALRFVRRVHVHTVMPMGSPLPFRVLNVEAAQTVWADSRTLRVLQSGARETVDGRPATEEIKTGLGYDQPPPAGTFDLAPPPGAEVTER